MVQPRVQRYQWACTHCAWQRARRHGLGKGSGSELAHHDRGCSLEQSAAGTQQQLCMAAAGPKAAAGSGCRALGHPGRPQAGQARTAQREEGALLAQAPSLGILWPSGPQTLRPSGHHKLNHSQAASLRPPRTASPRRRCRCPPGPPSPARPPRPRCRKQSRFRRAHLAWLPLQGWWSCGLRPRCAPGP